MSAQRKLKISVFGNENYNPDSTPLKIMPELIKKFPDYIFAAEDPNELNMPSDNEWCIIDTVVGLKKVRLIEMSELKKTPTGPISMHDFDLGMHLLWATKLNKNLKIRIVGVPPASPLKKAFEDVSSILSSLSLKNEKRS